MTCRLNRRHACVSLAMTLAGPTAAAQYMPLTATTAQPTQDNTSTAPFPTQRAIRLVVPFPMGGSVDFVARALVQPLSQALGQQVIIENRSGEAGLIGMARVLEAPADGYTLVLYSVTPAAVHPAVNSSLPYDPLRDLAPIMLVGTAPCVLMSSPRLGVRTHAQLLQKLRERPGQYSYATVGPGSFSDAFMQLYQAQTGTRMTRKLFRGVGLGLREATQGKIAVVLDTFPSAMPYILDKRLRPLAVCTDAQRMAQLPDIPTFAELGLPSLMQHTAFYGIAAPRALPHPILQTLHTALQDALQHRELRNELTRYGVHIEGGSPQDFASHIQSQLAHWKMLVADSTQG